MNREANKNEGPKYLIYLVAAFMACYLVQEFLFNRLIDIKGYYITGGSFIYFMSPIITDVITEVYGYRQARKVLWCGVLGLMFGAICVALCINAPHPKFWSHVTMAYSDALGPLLGTTMVSVIAVLVGQFTNAYLISKWKILTMGRYFWMRSVGSSVIGDTITVAISIAGVFGFRVPFQIFYHMIIPEFLIMLIFSALGALPAVVLANFLEKRENLSVYDHGVDFNPFKLTD